MKAGPDEFKQALRPLLPAMLAVACFSGAINLLYLSSPLYLMQIYNRVLASGSMPTLAMLTLALLVALLTMALLDAIRDRVLVRSSMRFDRLVAERVVTAMIERGAVQPGIRDISALRDFGQVRSLIASSSMNALFDGPWAPLYIVVLFLINVWLGLIALCGAVLLFAFAAIADRVTRARLKSIEAVAERGNTLLSSMARNADLVRAMAMTPALIHRWQSEREPVLIRQGELSDIAASFNAGIRFFRLLLQALILAVGAVLAVNQVILPVTIFAASIIMSRAIAPVEQAMRAWREFGEAIEAMKRLRALLNEQPPTTIRTRLPQPDGRLTIEKVCYSADERAILKDIDFELEAGEALGIIGPSGAGKSTLTRVLAGVIAPTSGKVKLGGVDLRLWRPDELGRHIGYLPDRVGLFAGSVRENIARFDDVSDRVVIAAARKAGIHEMVLGLPQGYDTEIRGACQLSGGECQRIGLARALLGSPRLVVLDEPNSHLDQDGERALNGAITQLKSSGATVVIVTHRPSLLGRLDKLLLIRRGRIEMFGSRDVLLERYRGEMSRPKLAQSWRTL
jgi:PrtD family type I secretion system ABC transporter